MAWLRRPLVISTALLFSWYVAFARAAAGVPAVTDERYAFAASWRLPRVQATIAVGARAPSNAKMKANIVKLLY